MKQEKRQTKQADLADKGGQTLSDDRTFGQGKFFKEIKEADSTVGHSNAAAADSDSPANNDNDVGRHSAADIDSDSELLNQIYRDNQEAFREIFHRYGRYTAAVAFKVGGNRLTQEDVEELCSDAFVKLWDNRKQLQLQGGTLKGWLGTVSRNLTLNLLRARSRRPEQSLGEWDKLIPSAEARWLEGEELKELFQAVHKLETLDRELFLRRHYYGERVTDIAALKGMNVKTVSARLIRIRRSLQAATEQRGIK